MYNQIIEQLAEKINTKYGHLNGLFQTPGAPSPTAELGREALGSLFPAPSAGFCGRVGGLHSRGLLLAFGYSSLGIWNSDHLCVLELGRDEGVSCHPLGQGAWVGQSQDTPALLSGPGGYWEVGGRDGVPKPTGTDDQP